MIQAYRAGSPVRAPFGSVAVPGASVAAPQGRPNASAVLQGPSARRSTSNGVLVDSQALRAPLEAEAQGMLAAAGARTQALQQISAAQANIGGQILQARNNADLIEGESRLVEAWNAFRENPGPNAESWPDEWAAISKSVQEDYLSNDKLAPVTKQALTNRVFLEKDMQFRSAARSMSMRRIKDDTKARYQVGFEMAVNNGDQNTQERILLDGVRQGVFSEGEARMMAFEGASRTQRMGIESRIQSGSVRELQELKQQMGATSDSPDLFEMVKGFEGYNPSAYDDYSQTSIGYGTKAKPGETEISEQEAEARLKSELSEASGYVLDAAGKGYDFSPAQIDALTSFTYNLGPGGLQQLLFNSDGSRRFDSDEEIAAKMLEYDNADGEQLEGLTKRRKAESELFLSGASGEFTEFNLVGKGERMRYARQIDAAIAQNVRQQASDISEMIYEGVSEDVFTATLESSNLPASLQQQLTSQFMGSQEVDLTDFADLQDRIADTDFLSDSHNLSLLQIETEIMGYPEPYKGILMDVLKAESGEIDPAQHPDHNTYVSSFNEQAKIWRDEVYAPSQGYPEGYEMTPSQKQRMVQEMTQRQLNFHHWMAANPDADPKRIEAQMNFLLPGAQEARKRQQDGLMQQRGLDEKKTRMFRKSQVEQATTPTSAMDYAADLLGDLFGGNAELQPLPPRTAPATPPGFPYADQETQ